MSELPLTLATFFALGLLSLPHCASMCGGIGLSLAQHQHRLLPAHLGRLSSYVVLGGASGVLGQGLTAVAPQLTVPLRTLAAAFVVIAALRALGWAAPALAVERAGARVIGARMRAVLPQSGFGWGVAWGLLPCGAVYSAVGASVGLGNAGRAALALFAFGVGTLPALYGAGWLSRHFAQKPGFRRAVGVLMLALALLGMPFDFGQRGVLHHHHNSSDQGQLTL